MLLQQMLLLLLLLLLLLSSVRCCSLNRVGTWRDALWRRADTQHNDNFACVKVMQPP
jgi:hypothetical protein